MHFVFACFLLEAGEMPRWGICSVGFKYSKGNLCNVLSKESASNITMRNNLFWRMLCADEPGRHAFGAGVTPHADNMICFRSWRQIGRSDSKVIWDCSK